MGVADPEWFEPQRLQAARGRAPAALCELAVHALELVAELARRGLRFRFKGGNSLLVLLDAPYRFSVDVDVASGEQRERFDEAVADVVADPSSRFVRQARRLPRTKPWLPMVSYRLWYVSAVGAGPEAHVMLDVVLAPAPYPGERRPLRSAGLYEAPLQVEVPTPSGLVGDKLLTLGPRTLGIPLGKGKEAQRIKHVFDIARLCERGVRLPEVREALQGCHAQECAIQRRQVPLRQALQDALALCEAALPLSDPQRAATCPDPRVAEVGRGFEGFRQHVFRIDYDWGALRRDLRTVAELLRALLSQPA